MDSDAFLEFFDPKWYVMVLLMKPVGAWLRGLVFWEFLLETHQRQCFAQVLPDYLQGHRRFQVSKCSSTWDWPRAQESWRTDRDLYHRHHHRLVGDSY